MRPQAEAQLDATQEAEDAPSANVEAKYDSSKPLVLRFGGSLVEQLGAQLYPSATATMAELLSNAWDADAKNVWVTIPFGASWTASSEIVVLDNGHGMTREQAQRAYLIVGRKRRLTPLGGRSESGERPVHGRKGIGKLAAFGTAGMLECTTVRDGVVTAFRLDYDKIRKLRPDEDYKVEIVADADSLVDPEGNQLTHGTQVRLTRLRLKKATNEDQFLASISRRFSLNKSEMDVRFNGTKELSRFNIPCEFRFPQDGLPANDVKTDGDWAVESLDGNEVRWWIGFTDKPLTEDQQQGISILANGKMAQRPFKFERSQGTEGQLGQEYMVGEVAADWLDFGNDIEDDLIQSNRDQLQLEDARLESFLAWGRRRMSWALRRRADLRRDKALTGYEASDEVKALLEPFTARERSRLLNVARAVSKLPEADEESVVSTMQSVLDAQSDRSVRELMERIEDQDDATQLSMWGLVAEFGLVDARRTATLIDARLATIRSLKKALATGAKEVPEIHEIVLKDPWLLDPRWALLDDEVDLTKLGVAPEPEYDEEGQRLDFLFALAPKPPAAVDEIVVVEIKRGTFGSGSVRKADVGEVQKFHQYVLSVTQHFEKSTDHPAVRGLMIAQGYTGTADGVRKSLETLPGTRLKFSTWDRVIEDTERMHLGWLNVSRERLLPVSTDVAGH